MPDFRSPLFHTEGQWHRPFTTRRCLHPPRSDRMVTLWAEGKLLLGRVRRGKDHTSYADLVSHGLWLVERMDRKLDFRRVRHLTPCGSVPVFGLEHRAGGFSYRLEAFCSTERNCRCYGKLTLKNLAPFRATTQAGLALRTGKEKDLAFGSPDEYISYDPELSAFLAVPPSWKQEGEVLRDGEATLRVKGEIPLSFDEGAGILRTEPLWLEPEEEKSLTFSFGLGEAADFDYEEKRRECLDFWETELSRIAPAHRRDPIEGFAVQILQGLCHYEGEEALVLRQGGLQRLIWPWEAMPALEALGRIGDFSREIEQVLSFYFDTMQEPDGEVKTVGEGWASVTASCLYSLATYAAQKGDPSYYARYRHKAMAAFHWLKAKRKESEGIEGAVSGLFPPMRGNDWPQLFQHWTNTDVFAYFSMRALEKAAKVFHDPRAGEIRGEADDYLSRLRTLFDAWSKSQTGDELRVPLTPDGNDSFFLEGFHPYLLQGAFVRTGAVSERDIDRILRYHERVGLKHGGLHSRMPYRDGTSEIFYTCNGDFHWFYTYLALGRKEEAQKVLEDTLTYSCTEEGVMIERYHADDPYYVPWSPNVSACGRTILMLLDLE